MSYKEKRQDYPELVEKKANIVRGYIDMYDYKTFNKIGGVSYDLLDDDINYIECKGLEQRVKGRYCEVHLLEVTDKLGNVTSIKAKLKSNIY